MLIKGQICWSYLKMYQAFGFLRHSVVSQAALWSGNRCPPKSLGFAISCMFVALAGRYKPINDGDTSSLTYHPI